MNNVFVNRSKIANAPGILIPDRPIAFNRDFVRLGIGIKGALFLSQAIYWSKRTSNEDGWFYKTVDEWESETGLTVEEQRGLKRILMDKQYLEVVKKGIPAKNYFRVELDAIADDLISLDSPVQSRENNGTGDGKIPRHSITESTTYISEAPLRVERVTKEDQEPKLKSLSKTPNARKVFEWFPRKQQSWHFNRTELQHAELLFARGEKQVKAALSFLAEHAEEEFCPKVTKPSDLERKWLDILAYKKKI